MSYERVFCNLFQGFQEAISKDSMQLGRDSKKVSQ